MNKETKTGRKKGTEKRTGFVNEGIGKKYHKRKIVGVKKIRRKTIRRGNGNGEEGTR